MSAQRTDRDGLAFKVDTDPPPPECGVARGERSRTFCELRPGHGGDHFGRSRSGRWYSWDENRRSPQ